jgi:uncharacterized membrane protein YeaQ/YmgE (transglycosylase-associated protein family)
MWLLNIIIGLILGFGASEELVERGIRGGLLQPAILGAAGVVASGLLIASGIALRRRAPHARLLTAVAAILTICVHLYGVLPPHHNVGVFAAILGTGYGLALLLVNTLRQRRDGLGAGAA